MQYTVYCPQCFALRQRLHLHNQRIAGLQEIARVQRIAGLQKLKQQKKKGGAGPGEKCNWSFACPTGYTCEGGICVARSTCGFLRVCPNNKNCWNGVCR